MTDGPFIVPLPHGAEPPYRVFITGVPQEEGVDYEIRGDEIVFLKPLVKEKLGFWRWTAMFLALFGSYGRNDVIDVQYQRAGKTTVATGLKWNEPQ